MEILLKRSKITNSIIEQALKASVMNLEHFDVIGWCISKKIKWIIFYQESTHELRKFIYFRKAFEEIDHSSKPFKTIIEIGGNFVPLTYQSETKEENDRFIILMNNIKKIADQKGQFYI